MKLMIRVLLILPLLLSLNCKDTGSDKTVPNN